jgi:hypothetical protein
LDIYTNNYTNNNNNSIILANSNIIEEEETYTTANLHSIERGPKAMNEKEHGACGGSGGGGDGTTAATSTANSDKITYNETFFTDTNHMNNTNFNPLTNDHITCYKKSLYDSLLREDDEGNDENDNDNDKSKTETSASFCRDGYVTNQRYQTFKDNKRSEMQRTHCYDEVFPAEQEECENSTEDDDDDDLYNDGELLQTNANRSASSSSSSSSSMTETIVSKSVVIQMNEDNEDDDDYMGKKKFENLIQKQELENIKKKNLLLNSAAAASSSMANKYDQEKNLLDKFQNECRLGSDKTTESVMKAKSVLIKLDMSTTSDRYSSILNSRECF